MNFLRLSHVALLSFVVPTAAQEVPTPTFRVQLPSPVIFVGTDAPSPAPSIVLPDPLPVMRANAIIDIQPSLAVPLDQVEWTTVPDLPDFLGIEPTTGRISGTIPTSQDYGTFQVVATRLGESGYADLRLDVRPPVIAAGVVEDIVAAAGSFLDIPIPFTGGEGVTTFEWVDDTNVPEWLEIVDGRLQGTAAVTTATDLRIRVSDLSGESETDPFSLSVTGLTFPQFDDLTLQVTKSSVRSDIEPIQGVAGTLIVSGGTSNGEFRLCADAACTQGVTAWGGTAFLSGEAQFIQLRQTASASPNAQSQMSISADGNEAWWNITTAPASKLTVGSSGVGSRDGFSARCGSWSGNVCNNIQIRADSGSGWWRQATVSGIGSVEGQWHESWWVSTGDEEAKFFCYIATGNKAYSNLTKSTTSGGTPFKFLLQAGNAYNSHYGEHSGYAASPPVTMARQAVTRSMNLRCSGW